MPLTPDEALAHRRNATAEQVQALCERIDGSLAEWWEGSGSVIVDVTQDAVFLQREAQRIYQGNGWKVERNEGKDGTCLTFSLPSPPSVEL